MINLYIYNKNRQLHLLLGTKNNSGEVTKNTSRSGKNISKGTYLNFFPNGLHIKEGKSVRRGGDKYLYCQHRRVDVMDRYALDLSS